MMIWDGIEVIGMGGDCLLNVPQLWAFSGGVPVWDWTILAQQVRDPDVMGQMQKAFQHFIESGQVWALIIGFVVGYAFKSLLPG